MKVIKKINPKEIELNGLNKLNHFSDMPSMNLDGAIHLEKRIVNIPSSPSLVGEF